jgi:hypothetical protein
MGIGEENDVKPIQTMGIGQEHDVIHRIGFQAQFWGSKIYSRLVVLTILKNIRQWEGLSHILWKTKNVPNHQPDDVPYHQWLSLLVHPPAPICSM